MYGRIYNCEYWKVSYDEFISYAKNVQPLYVSRKILKFENILTETITKRAFRHKNFRERDKKCIFQSNIDDMNV